MSDAALDWSGFQPKQKDADTAVPRFHIRSERNNYQSQQQGREICEDLEFVEIITPGLPKSSPCEKVTDEHKRRWPEQYAAFQKGMTPATTGTPLEKWPQVGASQVRMLKALEIHTMEQLAAVGDNILQNMGMGARELRHKAQIWLEAAEKGSAPISRLVEENARQKAELDLLKGQIAGQGAIIDELRGQIAALAAKKGAKS